ncbi:unnamed protein product, partial [Leptidea sinapis]
MKKNDEDDGKDNNSEGSLSDWVSGGPMGTKNAVLVFRSCVLASRTPSMESTTKTVGNNTGTTILLNKAKNMARRLVAEPHSFSVRPKNIMHDVMETFGNTAKYQGQAYVVRHVSDADVPETISLEEQGHDRAEHKRDIEDVLNDLSKITLKKHLNVENTTANIKPPEDPPPQPVKETKDDKKSKKNKGKSKRKHPNIQRTVAPGLDSDDSEHSLVKEVDSIKVLESIHMPARILKITYKLVNTETKLLHRLLQAHGLLETTAESKDFNLMWSGLHPKPDVLRALSPYQRHFDFIPTTFLMPAEYKDLCTTHYRTKGPWIVKPAASSRGRGIYIVNTPEQIPKGESVVVAKYIDKPLLIGGHKCDLRLYVCVTSIDPLLIYLYEEGLVRFATVKYDKTNKNLWNPCMHLCNYSINKYHTDYIKTIRIRYISGRYAQAVALRDQLITECRRVHSAENVCVRNKGTGAGGVTGIANLLTGEELRIVRAVRAQYARRGGFVRIFPSQNSWQKYSQYLDPVTGIAVCSTSLNNNVPYNVVQHNYNLLVHTHVLPHFQHATCATSLTDTPQSEADLEDVLLLVLRSDGWVATFLGDSRSALCVDAPAARLALTSRHTLLKHLASVAPINCRKYRPVLESNSRPNSAGGPSEGSETSPPPPPYATSDIVLKDSLKEEKPHNIAIKYARS